MWLEQQGGGHKGITIPHSGKARGVRCNAQGVYAAAADGGYFFKQTVRFNSFVLHSPQPVPRVYKCLALTTCKAWEPEVRASNETRDRVCGTTTTGTTTTTVTTVTTTTTTVTTNATTTATSTTTVTSTTTITTTITTTTTTLITTTPTTTTTKTSTITTTTVGVPADKIEKVVALFCVIDTDANGILSKTETIAFAESACLGAGAAVKLTHALITNGKFQTTTNAMVSLYRQNALPAAVKELIKNGQVSQCNTTTAAAKTIATAAATAANAKESGTNAVDGHTTHSESIGVSLNRLATTHMRTHSFADSTHTPNSVGAHTTLNLISATQHYMPVEGVHTGLAILVMLTTRNPFACSCGMRCYSAGWDDRDDPFVAIHPGWRGLRIVYVTQAH